MMASVLLWIGAYGFGFIAIVIPAVEEDKACKEQRDASVLALGIAVVFLAIALAMAHVA